MLEDFIAAYDYLKSHKDCNGQWVLWDFVLRLDCQYDMVKVPTHQQQCLTMADSPLLSRTNNNTATAALRRFRQP
jgi:hypothetical protein